MPEILFEDKFIIVCIKPSGVSSEQSDDGNDMVSILSDYRADKDEDDYIGVIHRLDKAVGGVMLYSKRNDTAAKLCAQVTDGRFQKEYIAVVEGETEDSGEMDDLLYHDSQKNKTYVVDRERKGVRRASLEYETIGRTVLESGKTLSAVRIRLKTGRTHQIRVQFASRKLPLLGDGKYGAKDNDKIRLHSCEISFTHPKTKERITFKSIPEWAK
jgi:23S rRNA pseudouridine1911/1915/1917 synthase